MYPGLFLSAFASATLLPGASETALLALLAAGRGEPVLLLLAATAGNVLGATANWGLGRFFASFRERRWFPARSQAYARAAAWFARYGRWTLLLSWLPVIGDPLTLVAGAMRVGLPSFLLLVSLGKAGRYLFLIAAFTWWQGG